MRMENPRMRTSLDFSRCDVFELFVADAVHFADQSSRAPFSCVWQALED